MRHWYEYRYSSTEAEEAEEMCIYTGTAQRFPTHVLALIPYTLSAAFALVKKTQTLVHVAVRVTRPNPSPPPAHYRWKQ
jgi:hypothetical protein